MSEIDNDAQIRKRFKPILEGINKYELTILNQMVVDRIRIINKASSLMHMSRFHIGDRVSWDGSDGIKRIGIIMRLNQKTASVKVTDSGYWNVSPSLLTKEE